MIAISSNDVDIAGLLSGRGTSDDHICHKGVVAGKKISRRDNTIIVGHSLREDILDLLGGGDRQPLGYIPEDQLHIGPVASQSLDRDREVGLAIGQHLHRGDIDHLKPVRCICLARKKQKYGQQKEEKASSHRI